MYIQVEWNISEGDFASNSSCPKVQKLLKCSTFIRLECEYKAT